MIFWWEGSPYPFEVLPGDALFIAGCLPMNGGKPLYFEHVVIAGQKKSVSSVEEFLQLRVYGMPESDLSSEDTPSTGISQGTAEYWLDRWWLGSHMGSSLTVWNLGCRETAFDLADVEFLLPVVEGAFRCKYEPTFRVDPTLSQEIATNCLGFVCSFLEHLGVKHLAEKFPRYPDPFYGHETETRTYPAPGHLAHVLHVAPSALPWSPKDGAEAEVYSRVVVTLDEVVRDGTGPCAI